MKLIQLIILLFITTATISQEIVDSTKIWSNMEEHCQPWGSTYSTDYFRFDVDTIINDTTYKKVWISEDEGYYNWAFYGAMIREENSRVYYRQLFGQEGLIYDFNLSIGDSVLIDNPRAVGEVYLHLVEIDSVETEDGLRERWMLTSSEYPDVEYWIRGIGSETGILNSSSGIFGGLCGLYTLLCQKQDDELVYMNPEYNSCYLITTSISDNPVDDGFKLDFRLKRKVIELNFHEETTSQISITDLTGNLIESIFTNSLYNEIDLNGQPTGIYIVSLSAKDKSRSIKVFLP